MFTPTEPNDTILLANLIELDVSSPVEGSGEIEDPNDVDLFEVELNAGDTLVANIDAAINGSALDAVLTIFDINGNQLAQNDDNSFEKEGVIVTETDPFQQFTALLNGTYYVGVSSSGNLDYDPTLAGSGIGSSSGSYNLELTLNQNPSGVFETEPNDTILLANAIVGLDSLSPVLVSSQIGNNPDLDPTNDVDLFKVELNAGDTLVANIDAAINGSALDAVLTIFDVNGNQLAQNEDNSFEKEGVIVTETDPFQQFTAAQDGTYYVGISSSGNLDYDPNVAGSSIGDSSGSYLLELTLTDKPPEIELFRFRNINFATGTYIFVGREERDAILADSDLSQSFELDGRNPDGSINPAFTASTQPGENLIPFFRLKSIDVPGTFLFVSTEEYNAIFAENSNQKDKWEIEGFDSEGNDIAEFYVFGCGTGQGEQFNRFQNTANNTFLFAGSGETAEINSDPNLSSTFVDQGCAFESIA